MKKKQYIRNRIGLLNGEHFKKVDIYKGNCTQSYNIIRELIQDGEIVKVENTEQTSNRKPDMFQATSKLLVTSKKIDEIDLPGWRDVFPELFKAPNFKILTF